MNRMSIVSDAGININTLEKNAHIINTKKQQLYFRRKK